MKTTYVDRANTNEKVFEKANLYRYKPEDEKTIQSFQQYVNTKHNKMLGHVIRQPAEAPHRQIAFHNNTFTPGVYINRRVGRPRYHLVSNTYERIWIEDLNHPGDDWKTDTNSKISQIVERAQNRLYPFEG